MKESQPSKLPLGGERKRKTNLVERTSLRSWSLLSQLLQLQVEGGHCERGGRACERAG